MTKQHLFLILIFLLPYSLNVSGQKKNEVKNDSNTPLHLLQPEYKTPYGPLTTSVIKETMDRVFNYLEKNTPPRVVDKTTGKVITNYDEINVNAQLERGTFRLASYEWGVTYSAMLAAAKSTGDMAYQQYVTDRFKFLSEVAPHFKRVLTDSEDVDPQMKQILAPRALDDAGAVCAAMIKAQLGDKTLQLKPLIDNYIHFIEYKEHRLADGTFARNRPLPNALWLDDMFMGIPPLAWMGRYVSDQQEAYYNEAAKQILQFADRMFIPEKKLYRHGCEVLDALPENHPQREKILSLLRSHIQGLAACQSGEGFWHQLLDRNDSYLETSATAIYVYCIAHAINKGWIDAMAYGPVAHLGWHAVSTAVNEQGQVGGTCVGTGMAFDPAFYYYRPVNVYAAHGYGPVIWAGAEMINLVNLQHPKMNDNAILYYPVKQETDAPIFQNQNKMKQS